MLNHVITKDQKTYFMHEIFFIVDIYELEFRDIQGFVI